MQPSRLPPITSTRPEEWTYLAEGGANVVLTLGPSSSPNDSPFSDKVVRLRKRRKGAAVPGQSGPLGGDADVDFHLSIIQPLLSDVVQLETLAVTREWLEGIDRVLNQRASRPRVRRETDAIDLDSHSVVVAQDLVSPLRGEIAFEIKVPRPSFSCARRVTTLTLVNCFSFPKSRNGVSSLRLGTSHPRPDPSRQCIAGSACTATIARDRLSNTRRGTVRSTSTAVIELVCAKLRELSSHRGSRQRERPTTCVYFAKVSNSRHHLTE